MADTIFVKPSPANPAFRTLRHPTGATLLDASGSVPAAGQPWPYDGFTCRMLTDRAVLRAGDPVFAAPAEAQSAAPAEPAAPEPAPPAPTAAAEPAAPTESPAVH